MTMHSRVSDKGQIVVPKPVRERLGWESGTELEVIEGLDAVTFRRVRPGKTKTPAQAVADFRRLYVHEGPPASLEDMDRAIVEEAERRTSPRG